MRSDFLGDCAQFRDLPEALNDSQYLIPRLTRGQLRRAIEGPVAVGGATMTPQLVNRLLNDVGDNPDQLPILQHALMRTWDYWEDLGTPETPIDVKHYEAIGGMATALSRHADQIYKGLPNDRSRYIAEILFKRLTDRGADNREIRRPTQLGELCGVAEAEVAEVVAVIDAFRGARRSFLMPPAGVGLTETSVIDISHESLMRNWQQLKDWVNQEDQSANIYRRLAETTELYEQGKANYWRDPELTIGLTWLREQRPNAVWAERYASNFDEAVGFLQASADAREEEAVSKERAKKREINRLRTFLVLLGGLSLLTGGASVFAFSQQQKADEQAKIAIEQKKEAEDQKQIAEDQTQIAEAQKTEAQDQKDIALAEKERANKAQKEAEEQKQQAEEAQKAEAEQRQLAEGALQRAEEGEAEATRQAGIAREQTVIANQQTEISQENALRAEAATVAAEAQALNSEILADSLTVENLIASKLNFKALLNAIELGKDIRNPAGTSPYQDPVRSELGLQATSSLREAYYLPSYPEKNTFPGHTGSVSSVSFSPDGQTIASGSSDGTVKLWDRSGRELQTLEGHTGWVLSVSFSPDGQTIASGSDDGTVKLWDRSGRELQTLEGHTGSVRSVSFSPDGQTLAS
ncbi:hypothetical protein IXB28_04250, partial [Leptothoe kymatousa TAU-MAC 1615]|nr:hypothetical protein [Leptothoe kymatousa TAU-MAC 1615]